jgi:pyruvate formate lyase activating enzyme
MSFEKELFFNETKCINCCRCVNACKYGAHTIQGEKHVFNSEKCVVCGKCESVCPSKAIEIIGKTYTIEEVLEEILKDKVFYKNSGGGVTISGGEPLCHYDFTLKLLKTLKENGIHTAIETNGYIETEKILNLKNFVDVFLFDYKITNPSTHLEYTGASNNLIIKNLLALDNAGAKTILRCPIIANVNDNNEHFLGISNLANSLKNVIKIDVEPYHSLGEGKYEKQGKTPYKFNVASDEEVASWVKEIQKNTNVKVEKA